MLLMADQIQIFDTSCNRVKLAPSPTRHSTAFVHPVNVLCLPPSLRQPILLGGASTRTTCASHTQSEIKVSPSSSRFVAVHLGGEIDRSKDSDLHGYVPPHSEYQLHLRGTIHIDHAVPRDRTPAQNWRRLRCGKNGLAPT
jgi:hypothetical protein